MEINEIGKTISHALRHEPWLYELEVDSNGWVNLDALMNSLRSIFGPSINVSDIQKIIDQSNKPRFEISNEKIRALYGHSLPEKIIYLKSEPPIFLYHGTTSSTAEIILKDGLKPMVRQYVHLSTSIDIANNLAKRKGKDIKILKIYSKEAFNDGCDFYKGNQYVWLATYIPPKYIEIII